MREDKNGQYLQEIELKWKNYDTSAAGHIQAGDEPLASAQRELFEELGIKADEEDLTFAGTFHIEYSKIFHGKLFNDKEVAFVYVYEKPVDPDKLILQTEEVEEVKWFDIEDVIKGCEHRDGTFCVPSGGLKTVLGYLRSRKELQEAIQAADDALYHSKTGVRNILAEK